MATIISASEVTVRYGDRTILDAITLGIQDGERLGLVGRNGAGKTTFLRILAGLQSPDSGDVSRRRELVVSEFAFAQQWLGHRPGRDGRFF